MACTRKYLIFFPPLLLSSPLHSNPFILAYPFPSFSPLLSTTCQLYLISFTTAMRKDTTEVFPGHQFLFMVQAAVLHSWLGSAAMNFLISFFSNEICLYNIIIIMHTFSDNACHVLDYPKQIILSFFIMCIVKNFDNISLILITLIHTRHCQHLGSLWNALQCLRSATIHSRNLRLTLSLWQYSWSWFVSSLCQNRLVWISWILLCFPAMFTEVWNVQCVNCYTEHKAWVTSHV